MLAQTPYPVYPDGPRRQFTAMGVIAALAIGAILGIGGTLFLADYPVAAKRATLSAVAPISTALAASAQAGCASLAECAHLLNRAVAPVSQPTPQPTLEATPVAPVEETPPVAAVTPTVDADPPALPVPPPATKPVEERAREDIEKLRERFQGVTRPQRLWPDPRKFDKVSTKMLERFGVMTVDEFFRWSEAYPEQWRRVPKVIDAAFEEAKQARVGYLICEICLGARGKEFCDGLESDARALSEQCNRGVKWLGKDNWPLSNVLAERWSRKPRMK